MNKYPLIGGSICAVVLIVLASLTNVVGYQTVQSSNQKMITSEIDQKELLFQTIADMSRNKEIQKVILSYKITEKRFYDFGMRFSTLTFPVISEKILKYIYTVGLMLFRTLSKSEIQSLIERRPIMNQEMQNEISNVVEKDAILRINTMQLSDLKCDCDNGNMTQWNFPIFCTCLALIFLVVGFFYATFDLFFIMYWLTLFLGVSLNCWWAKFVWP